MRANHHQRSVGNGAHQAHANEERSRANGVTRKRSPARTAQANGGVSETPGAPDPADFIPPAVGQFDAEMWPVQPVIWFERTCQPALPASSGLRLERHYKFPVPGFLQLERGGGYRPAVSEIAHPGSESSAPETLQPEIPLVIPPSGLALLGWDPRTLVRPEEKK
ncbi:MAG TPA: hypothetical protein VMH81_18020 [Bryobacteraceae bacterium]|nr:hypothetical protein [Bryobacteraceae bacterium]